MPRELHPSSPEELRRHKSLERLRDKVYAHTDKAGGRWVELGPPEFDGEYLPIPGQEGWFPFPRELLPLVIEHMKKLHAGFWEEAVKIPMQIHSEAAGA